MSSVVDKTRLHLLDSIRGLTLISMIIYHGVWDIVNILDVNWRWFRSDAAFIWQQSICWTFILLSGFCVQLGSNLIRRGLLVFGGGVLISVITVLFVPSSSVTGFEPCHSFAHRLYPCGFALDFARRQPCGNLALLRTKNSAAETLCPYKLRNF